MFEIPLWIQVFVVVGVCLLVVVVPLKILWEMRKDARERRRKRQEVADRLRERFSEVRFSRSPWGSNRIRFKHEGRPVTLHFTGEEEIEIRLDVRMAPQFPVVLSTKGGLEWPRAWEGWRFLPRVRTNDALLDDAVRIYSTAFFGAYLRELALDGIPLEEKPEGIAASIIVLRRTPGIRWFQLRMSESGGFRVRFRMRTEDLLYRPDELEAVVHHTFRLYDALVLYFPRS